MRRSSPEYVELVGICRTVRNAVLYTYNYSPEHYANLMFLLQYDSVYEVILTTTYKPELGREIMGRLQPNPAQAALFWIFCFGPWVDVSVREKCYPLLCHYLLCTEVVTHHPSDFDDFYSRQMTNGSVLIRNFLHFYGVVVRGVFSRSFIVRTG